MRVVHLFFVLFLASQTVEARDECFHTLVQDTNTLNLDAASSFALLDMMWQNMTEEERKKANIDVTGYGSANDARVQKRTQEFYRQTGIRWNQRTKLAMASQTLSANSVEAYRICKDGEHKFGPRAIAYAATSDEVTVKVSWFSPPGAPTRSAARWQVSGGSTENLKNAWRTGESESFIFKRTRGKDLRLIVSIGGQSDELFVPYNPTVRETISYSLQRYPQGEGKRMANDGTGRNQGPITDCITVASGQELDPANTTVNITTKVGNLDATSYAKLIHNDYTKACYEAFLRPLSRTGGGDMRFHISYRLGTLSYQLID